TEDLNVPGSSPGLGMYLPVKLDIKELKLIKLHYTMVIDVSPTHNGSEFKRGPQDYSKRCKTLLNSPAFTASFARDRQRITKPENTQIRPIRRRS
ncbi:MAG: hypothetical protein ACE14P_13690, partial [Methanotrichaceae archaeon]